MKIYNYNKITGEFTSELTAQLDPLATQEKEENIYLIPANATAVAPPELAENEVAVFDGEDWEIKADFRGQKVYNKETKQQEIISEIGEIDRKYTKITPTNNYQIWDKQQNNWVIDESKRVELIRLNRDKINGETEHKIINDFIFNEVNFKLTAENQRNFDNECRMRESLNYPHKIKSVDGYYMLKNADEYQAFYLAGISHVRNCLEAGWSQKDVLNDLTTEELINKLT